MKYTDEELAKLEKSRPRSYDLSDEAERERLLREVVGHMRVSLFHGTGDYEGRKYAYDALARAFRVGFRLKP